MRRLISPTRCVGLVFVGVVMAGLTACTVNKHQPSTGEIRELFERQDMPYAIDSRARFRQLFCRVNEARGPQLPDYRSCEDALRTLSPELPDVRAPVPVDYATEPFTILIVPGLGYDCFAKLIGGDHELVQYAEELGHRIELVPVAGLGDSERNASIVRDMILTIRDQERSARVILFGYSKGAVDILTALVAYPEIVPGVAAVISSAGSIGGSPLAETSSQHTLDLLASLPGSDCEKSDVHTLDSMSPALRSAWLAAHQLPDSVAYFSLLAYPQPERVSVVLRKSFNQLSETDPMNDSQVLVRDQIIPGSEVLAITNADHWAIALPIKRSSPVVGSTLISQNDFPREVLFQAILIYVDAALESR